MNDLVKSKNTSYDRYEELLLRREELKKSAFLYEQAYVRTFGDLLLEIFQLKIECIRKKKTIEFCQAAINRGKTVDQARLQVYLMEQMEAFQQQLDTMIREREAARENGLVTERELLEIKKIYHRLVKKIHPDMNPKVKEFAQLQDLWQRTLSAYHCNDLKTLEETEILVDKLLSQLAGEVIQVDIPNIEEKIQELEEEVQRIRETDPYQYRYLLEDPQAVQEKTDSLLEEKKSYQDYSKQLEEILQRIFENGGSITWQMT